MAVQLPPQQELASLRVTRAELLKEKDALSTGLTDWKAKISEKKAIITRLEETVTELQKPNGRRTGLLRCAAEYGQSTTLAEQEPAPPSRPTGPSLEEISLSCRLASAVAAGPSADITFGWSREDFEKEFTTSASDPLQQLFSRLSCEQRLVWELQNPPEHSLKVDRQLLGELQKAGRRQEAELLLTAVGPPSGREREYRSLLWLQHHPDLDAGYVEQSVGSTSLLMLACKAGYSDTARELVSRRADVHHANKENSTALLAACNSRSWDCARLLLEGGADANTIINGTSLLTWVASIPQAGKEQQTAGTATQSPPEALVQTLLACSAVPDAVDKRGRTALMHAAMRDKRSTCEALLAGRADLCKQDSEGKTAVEVAVESQNFSLADWLDGLA